MASVYILYSRSIDAFYIGSCRDLEERLPQHKDKRFSFAFTARADDWEIFLSIANLQYEQARKIESHIKKNEKQEVYPKFVKVS